MKLSYCEEIKRNYNNGVKIIYEKIDNENLYIHFINSLCCKQKNGTRALNSFLEEFRKYNIYIFSSDELGTKKEILDKWYERLGFIKTNNLEHIPYNISHVKIKGD